MQIDKVKAKSDEMALKIAEYIMAAEPDDEEQNYRFMELAATFITLTIDVNQKHEDIVRDCIARVTDIAIMISKVTKSDDINILKEWNNDNNN